MAHLPGPHQAGGAARRPRTPARLAPGRDAEAGLCPAEPQRGKVWKPSQGFHVIVWIRSPTEGSSAPAAASWPRQMRRDGVAGRERNSRDSTLASAGTRIAQLGQAMNKPIHTLFSSCPGSLAALTLALATLLLAAACSDGSSTGTPGAACGGCAADELCVQTYDGTCRPMAAMCKKVSAACQTMARTQPETCMAAANAACPSEICGERSDAGLFFACGNPKCQNEVEGTDIGCYGP
jgi:hypothetical protein